MRSAEQRRGAESGRGKAWVLLKGHVSAYMLSTTAVLSLV